MLFNSAIFGLFIAVLLPLYGVLRGSSARKWLLLFASYLFYANWDYRYLPLLWLSTVVDYLVGARLGRTSRVGVRRLLLLASLVTNLGILAVFKYGNFLALNLARVFPAIDPDALHLADQIPVGISFYTFQTLSYTIDVYRGNEARCRSPLDFALYVSLFAQLVAGPIVRSGEFLPQIRRMPDLRLEEIAGGAQRFALGLFKKVVLADNAALFVDAVFATPGEYGAVTLWCGAYAFALQIYCDFSGYTDMALGIGRAFGLKLPENFDAPYLSASITEFWRRWHMSLSRWLRDYLYIPLGGSRRGQSRTYVNLMLTMLLGGLWHGAAWTFVLWGGMHGVLLAFERALGIARGSEGDDGKLRLWIRQLVTFHLVCLAWIVFRAPSFGSLRQYLAGASTDLHLDAASGQGAFWAVVLALLCTGQFLCRRFDGAALWDRLPAPAQGLGLAVLLVVVGLFHVDDVAFIYFQF